MIYLKNIDVYVRACLNEASRLLMTVQRQWIVGVVAVGLFWCCSSCNNTKFVPRNAYLYKGATIDIATDNWTSKKERNATKANLMLIAKPQANKPFKLWVYNNVRKPKDDSQTILGWSERTRRLNQLEQVGKAARRVNKPLIRVDSVVTKQTYNLIDWLQNRLGEAPVLLDSSVIKKSAKNMQTYLFEQGYYFNKVTAQIQQKNKKATVTYHVSVEAPFVVRNAYLPEDTTQAIVREIRKVSKGTQSLVVNGKKFSADNLQTEINRLVWHLKNQGYFDFNSQYLSYKLDSLHQERIVDTYLSLKNPPKDSIHRIHRLRNVYIISEYNPLDEAPNYDTLLYQNKGATYHYLCKNPYYLHPQIITDYLFLKPGSLYSAQNATETQKRITELGLYKFVNINFKKIESDSSELRYLDTYIYLTPSKRHQLSADLEVNNLISQASVANNALGLASRVAYTNKNLLHRGELFTSSLSFGISFNTASTKFEDNLVDDPINTVLLDGETKLTLPQFLFPFPKLPKKLKVSSRYRPKTVITFQGNLSRRISFANFLGLGSSFGYDWQESNRKRHVLHPISLNLLSVTNKQDNFNRLVANNPFLQSSFDNRVIVGGDYTYTYTEQKDNTDKFWYFRGGIESAGLLMQGIDVATGSGQLRFFGIDYAQYIRTDLELKRYIKITKDHAFVTRFSGGIGVPFQKNTSLPFNKQFFIGGVNSMRGFQIRSVGPGSLYTIDRDSLGIDQPNQVPSEYERTGDMKIELNAEYRFPIWWYLKGAFFVDVGNIWALSEQQQRGDIVLTRYNSVFKIDKFWRDFAINTGLGFRFDVTYFVLRFDIGMPIYNPSKRTDRRWIFQDNYDWRGYLNPIIAVGYPF